ncbi:MAG: 2Fe-2S iron-sulfur cluster-binding protein, partial [Rhodothermia bacterium]
MPGFRLTFLPQKKSGVFAEGTTLRDAALELGILIDSTCAGIGTCGKCKVVVKSGVSPSTAVERQVLSSQELEKGVRLSCQAFVKDNTICTIPDTSLSLIENIATEGVAESFDVDPDIQKIVLSLEKPDLGARYFIAETAVQMLADLGVPVAQPDIQAVRSLAVASRHGWGTVTATLDGDRLLGFDEGDTSDHLFGVAIDIGTTTLAAKLVDLRTNAVVSVSTSANPQAAHGADVVARIQYTIRHSGGLRKLGKLVISRLNEMISGMVREV